MTSLYTDPSSSCFLDIHRFDGQYANVNSPPTQEGVAMSARKRRNPLEQVEERWLLDLFDSVTASFEAQSPMGSPGMRYHEEEGFWEVCIFPTPVELIGGAHDGDIVEPEFTVDLEQLRSAFDSITAFAWTALGLNFEEGPHVSVEGVYRERQIFLQILAHAPEDEEPGLRFDASEKPPRPT